MGASTSVGPVSGIDYGALITGLTAVDQAGITSVTNRITVLNNQDQALTSLNTLVTGLKISSASFLSSSIFRATTTNSANPGVLTATGGIGSPTGNYSFSVQRLAAASQQVTQGFSSSSAALGLSGTFTVQTGGGLLTDVASLSQLNGGNGVARGSIRITDGSGASTVIDLSNAVDVNDVVNAINSASGVSVNAKITDDHLVLTDESGGTGALKVANTGGTTTAADLGLTGTSTGGVLTGTSLTKISAATSLNTLNDGNGVRASQLPDFTLQGATGGPFTVSIGGAKTVGDVINAINSKAGSTGVSAAVSADGSGISITDANGGPVTVTPQSGSLAAYDLGLTTGTSSGGTLVGSRIADVLSGPLLRDLNGGNQGTGSALPQPGTIVINGQTIDLSNASSLQDVIDGINTNTSGVTAAINGTGTGITLTSASGNITVADGTGNLGSFLGIAKAATQTATGSQISSGNLNLSYISSNTLLSTLNGGTGVTLGKIQLSDGTNGATVDLSSATTIGDVINAINSPSNGLKIKASINSTGNGILLTQTGGTGTASVSDVNGGKTAAQLGIAGNFTSGTLNGSFQKTITIKASDSLSTIATDINNLGIGASASVINDGSSGSPFRLSISSRNSGQAGRLVIDDGSSGLTTSTLVQGQNAVVVYGGNSNGTGGLLTTSSSNSISGLIPSLTLNLTGVGQTTISVTNDTSQISSAIQTFVDSYNKVIQNITTATAFDSTGQGNNGVLFGNSTVQQVTDALGAFVNQSYAGYGSLTSLSDIGITVAQDGTLSLDTDTLNSVLASDPTDVQKIFTTNVAATVGGAPQITASTALSTLGSGSPFPAGSINLTDANGTVHNINLSSAKTIGDVLAAINSGANGTVTASINGTTLAGIVLTQVGNGTQAASISDVGNGTTAAFLNLKGTFSNGTLDGEFPPTLPTSAQKGIGATLSDLVTRFSDAQTGVLFDASTALETQEQQLNDQQNSLTTLLASKKQLLLTQFANLESTIAGLQAQGSALSSIGSSTSTSSTASKSSTA